MKDIKPLNEDKSVNVIIDTPMGSRNKFEYDPGSDLFKLSKTLPLGTVFPHHFGFIPGTEGGDGDPLDVLVILDRPTYPGILLESRIIGVIEAKQKEGKKVFRNDRFLAIPVATDEHVKIKSITDMEKKGLEEIISFFKYYNAKEGRRFSVIGIKGPQKAISMIGNQTKK